MPSSARIHSFSPRCTLPGTTSPSFCRPCVSLSLPIGVSNSRCFHVRQIFIASPSMNPGHRLAKRLISCAATLALVSLVLLHQVFAGVFVGGTVLCIGGASGFAVQPVGMTCCATHGAGTASAADPCCDDDAPSACPTAAAPACDGCTDYLLTVQIALPATDAPVALPASPLVVIGLLDWPEVSSARLVYDRRVNDRAPPLAFLRTVVLRC